MARRAGKRAESTRRQSLKPTTNGKSSASPRPAQPETHVSKPKHNPLERQQAGSAHGSSAAAEPQGVFRRVASRVGRFFSRAKAEGAAIVPKDVQRSKPPVAARVARRETDVPMDQIENAYIPTQTSLKGPFRTSGDDRQRDQELARGFSDDRWNDEDRITNKSGDPRIGTHGRTYEPGEARAVSNANDE